MLSVTDEYCLCKEKDMDDKQKGMAHTIPFVVQGSI